jgi:hypothetical protein
MHPVKALTLVCSLLILTSCGSPYVKTSSKLETEAPKRALLQSLVVRAPQLNLLTRGFFTAAIEVAGGRMATALEEQKGLLGGMDVYLDKEVAGRFVPDHVGGGQVTAMLDARWYHGETSQLPLNRVNLTTAFQGVLDELDATFKDGLASVDVEITNPLWNNVPALYATKAVVTIQIYNRDGDLLYVSKAWDSRGLGLFGPDLSEDTLVASFVAALEVMKRTPIEPIGSIEEALTQDMSRPRAMQIAMQ